MSLLYLETVSWRMPEAAIRLRSCVSVGNPPCG